MNQPLGRIALGKLHRLHLVTRQSLDWVGDLYVPEEIVIDPMGTWNHGREMVLYRAITGSRKGKAYVCTIVDFAIKFRLEEKKNRRFM